MGVFCFNSASGDVGCVFPNHETLSITEWNEVIPWHIGGFQMETSSS